MVVIDAQGTEGVLHTSSFKKVRDFWERNAVSPPERPLSYRTLGEGKPRDNRAVMLSGFRKTYTPREGCGHQGNPLSSKESHGQILNTSTAIMIMIIVLESTGMVGKLCGVDLFLVRHGRLSCLLHHCDPCCFAGGKAPDDTPHGKSTSLGSHPVPDVEEEQRAEDGFSELVASLRGDMATLDTHLSRLNIQMKVMMAEDSSSGHSTARGRASSLGFIQPKDKGFAAAEHCRRASCQI